MKYDIELSYDDKYSTDSPNDFRLNIRSTFDDEAAPFVAEILEHFYQKFAENKDAAKKKAEANIKI